MVLCRIAGFTGSDAMRRPRRSLARIRAIAVLTASLLALAGCASSKPSTVGGEPAGEPKNFRALGPADAPVTLVEYTDMQCPYCAAYARKTFPELKRLYIDKGKVRYESRDLPLSFHAFALPAAIAARCAGEQGKYWPYRDVLAQRQDELPQAPYGAWAAELGLDAERFAACRNSEDLARSIRTEAADAQAMGITGTPTFVIRRTADDASGGETIHGAEALEVFRQKIDALLEAGTAR
jgi:protein-disulfide isomerase